MLLFLLQGEGNCSFGLKCDFAHNEMELRTKEENEEHLEITHNIQGTGYYFHRDYHAHFIHSGLNVQLCSLLKINKEHLKITYNIQGAHYFSRSTV